MLYSALAERGFDYHEELIKALRQDLSKAIYRRQLDILVSLLPYMAIKFGETEIKTIEELSAEIRRGERKLENKGEAKLLDMNEKMLMEREKQSVGGIKS